MASKLRRAPLFGLDNPLRIPSLPKYSSPPAINASTGYKLPKSSPAPAPQPAPKTVNVKPSSITKSQIISNTPPGKTAGVVSSIGHLKSLLSVNNNVSNNRTVIKTINKTNGSCTTITSNQKPSTIPTLQPSIKLSAVAQLKLSANKSSKSTMEVGVAYPSQQQRGNSRVGGASPDRGRGSPKTSLHVDFAAPGEMKERKEKYLTAKYGAHQMALIRKRLGVEMWMFDQLQSLYPPKTDGKNEEKEVDLDELLDLEDDTKRRGFLRQHLADCTYPEDDVLKFIDELMDRAKIL